MRGAFHEDVIRAPSSALGTVSGKSQISRKAPPSSAFGTFSPSGGRRTLDEGSGKTLEGNHSCESVRNAG